MKRSFLSISVMGLVSLLGIVYILFDTTRPGAYSLLWLLPLINGVMLLIFVQFRVNIHRSIPIACVAYLYFVRFSLTPIVMTLGNYNAPIRAEWISETSNQAIIIMAVEGLIVSIYASIRSKRQERRVNNELYDGNELCIISKDTHPKPALVLFFVMLVFYSLWTVKLDDSVVKSTFINLVSNDNQYYALASPTSGIGTLSMYVELLQTAFEIIQILIPPLLLHYLMRMRSMRLSLTISLCLCIVVIIVGTENRINSIYAGLAFLYTINAVYKHKYKATIRIVLLCTILLASLGLMIKGGVESGGQNPFSGLSATLCAYFSGVPTVAMGMKFVGELEFIRIWRIIPDTLYKMPYLAYVIKLTTGMVLENSNSLFNSYLSAYTGRVIGQILPTTALGFEYFSYLFGSILPCIMIGIAFKLDEKRAATSDVFKKHLYGWVVICVSVSPIIASAYLSMEKVWMFVLMISILNITNKRMEKHNKAMNTKPTI